MVWSDSSDYWIITIIDANYEHLQGKLKKQLTCQQWTATIDSESSSALYVSTDACVYVAVLQWDIKDPQFKQRVSLTDLIFLSIPDDLIPLLPPLNSVTSFRQLTAESRSVALLNCHILQLLLEGDGESWVMREI